ncbi:MAG: hypothetical protein ACREJC_05055 [Tepidisphaeraceae bacterium]
MTRASQLAAALLLAVAAGCSNPDPAQKLTNVVPGTGFSVHTVKSGGSDHKYSVFIPRNYNKNTKYPTVIFLHGIGEAGSDGVKSRTVGIGPAIGKRNGDFPFIVLFPQAGWDWTSQSSGQLVMDVLHDAEKSYSIDQDRVILTGMSSGGKGVWVLGARYVDVWSALVPMGSYPSYDDVQTLTRLPIWALHNDGDFIVPVGGTREMVKRIKAAGGNIKYSEFDAGGHNCWDAAYDQGELFVWLQQQRRNPANAAGGKGAGGGTAAPAKK